MKYVPLTGKLKQRSWVVVKECGKIIEVKVMHLAGKEQTSFMARRRKKDMMVLYFGWHCVGTVKDLKTIKKLQAGYYA